MAISAQIGRIYLPRLRETHWNTSCWVCEETRTALWNEFRTKADGRASIRRRHVTAPEGAVDRRLKQQLKQHMNETALSSFHAKGIVKRDQRQDKRVNSEQ